ncbi:hypothetical protein VE02_02675 [Pseudogymnoascus sp. 03VT05]|nr:hypothetical protein VE02_02675 [Pseudogymnoascus sp. 03VT05]
MTMFQCPARILRIRWIEAAEEDIQEVLNEAGVESQYLDNFVGKREGRTGDKGGGIELSRR